MDYLYHGEIQEKLNQYMEQYGVPCTLTHAIQILQQEGILHCGEALPKVSFSEWNIQDMDQFDKLIDQTGFPIVAVVSELPGERMERVADQSKPELEILPAKKFENQAPGERSLGSFGIYYTMQGEASLLYDKQRCKIPQGTVCITSPWFRYEVLAERGCKVIGIFLSENTIDETLYKVFRQSSVVSEFFRLGLGGGRVGYQMFALTSEEEIRSILRNVFDEYYSCREYSGQMCAAYIEILLTQILRQCDDVARQYNGRAERNGAPPMLAVLKYIQSNYQTASLKSIAEQFHYEPSYLGRLLKSHVGKSFTDLVRELKLGEAEKLLRETGLSIEKTAEKSGFHNSVHFFREFRRAYGVTPGEYRKQKMWEKTGQQTR